MSAGERRATVGLAVISGVRMLGLFLLLPVFSLYGMELAGATPLLVGFAIGAYGLTQALLQIPAGWLSDRIGRRPVIVGGLVLFAAGSVLAAISEGIWGVIAGRALQGCGAIMAAVMALAADLTRVEQRTKVMAFIGISVGGAFLVALVAGPAIAAQAGLAGVFWATAGLALVAMALLWVVVPAGGEATARPEVNARSGALPLVLRDPDLLRLDFGILVLHFVLTASFVALPIVLERDLGIHRSDHWQLYVPVLVLSVFGMWAVLAVGERQRILHRLLAALALLLVVADLVLAAFSGWGPALVVALWLFFVGFNSLEAGLPSLLTRFAPADLRGTALGVYATSQFIGAFLGGALGGLLYGIAGVQGVFILCAAVAALWFLSVRSLRAPEACQPSAEA
ncbi:MFS transporter [Spiribacter halobius]|uniref:MFS transporter n=1 Tax=Sediminicurvatus halobius TaxID=2182432 RepID=A0A2U2N578_9GAMM|nr:MFS transporter [Spiribacter halobius]PWG64139.1 MFS transporter [Spiribacter halobius]UEX79962.1 MFS transporter [Spiribacter halobius]